MGFILQGYEFGFEEEGEIYEKVRNGNRFSIRFLSTKGKFEFTDNKNSIKKRSKSRFKERIRYRFDKKKSKGGVEIVKEKVFRSKFKERKKFKSLFKRSKF